MKCHNGLRCESATSNSKSNYVNSCTFTWRTITWNVFLIKNKKLSSDMRSGPDLKIAASLQSSKTVQNRVIRNSGNSLESKTPRIPHGNCWEFQKSTILVNFCAKFWNCFNENEFASFQTTLSIGYWSFCPFWCLIFQWYIAAIDRWSALLTFYCMQIFGNSNNWIR